jgi:RNA polymerase sigma factor (sigma-70 family)
MPDDRRLIQQLKRGDKEALRQIYQDYKDDLLTVATSLLHDACAAEDILHDVFVSFASGIGRLELRRSLRSYLMTSVVNRVRDRFRKKGSQAVGLGEIDAFSSENEGPEQRAVFGEQSRKLAKALALLPLEQREVIVLHLNGGMKFKEIGELQGISPSTVQGRYRYGVDKLRTILNGALRK